LSLSFIQLTEQNQKLNKGERPIDKLKIH